MTREEAIAQIKKWDFLDDDKKKVLETLVPELHQESEDEMIRKALIGIITNYVDNSNTFKPKMIAWLEKQNPVKYNDEKDERIRKAIICGMNALKDQKKKTFAAIPIDDCITWLEKQRQGPKRVSIWKHWKDGIAGNGDGKQIYLIKTGNIYDISSCLGCECDYIELSELDKLTREEKQMEQKPVNEVIPKFNVDDFIVNDYCFGKVIEITNDAYLLDTGQGIPFSCEHNAHLWTIQDAKDGDVLVVDNMPFIYNGSKNEVTVGAYCGFNTKYKFSFAYNYVINQNITPATKEQCNLLFQKMHEAGYEWDAEKKELKEIGTPEEPLCISPEEYNKAINECWRRNKSRWSEEDKSKVEDIIYFLNTAKTHYASTEAIDDCVEWLESLKQRML